MAPYLTKNIHNITVITTISNTRSNILKAFGAAAHTHTAPFLNPFSTANAALYFSCCSKLLMVYRTIFTKSGPAMTSRGANGGTSGKCHNEKSP